MPKTPGAQKHEPASFGFNRFGIDPSAAPPEEAATPEWLMPKASKPVSRNRYARYYPTQANLVTDLATSSPGKLVIAAFVLIVMCVSAGAITATSISARQDQLDTMISSTEPIAHSALELYTALSVADAAASTAFVFGGIEPDDVRTRYIHAARDAARSLVNASSQVGEENTRAQRLLAEIAMQLPIYTGLIETARANNRVGNPVGAAYLNEASHLMRTEVLPRSEDLYRTQAARISDGHDTFIRPPLLAVFAVFLVIVALVAAQFRLSRKTQRTINAGWLIGSLLMTLVLVWLLTVGLYSRAEATRAADEGARPLEALATVRILAQQARSDETLGLARRGEAAEIEASFRNTSATLTQRLTALHDDARVTVGRSAIDDAITANEDWVTTHDRMSALYSAGDHLEAANIAVGPGTDGSTASFAALDDALQEGITDTRAELRSALIRARTALVFAAGGVLGLSVAAGLAIAAGVWPRLREYQ
ncbi:hypothetical protein ONR57_00790 [Hoyosella sp. YIM 151337]|uniref:hypothetical protein n=1 Tax=Hoyosella sp. YIM 151337 TaxID=2992742 RepID=UPI00223637F7|nr:hypothetical protein [Hoyosella sp. YIM 151337]MCW4351834.1 hypothetical protein [Hoyosella sp. YIM 151337]